MYDLIIIGFGPAAISAGVYAGRYRLKTLLIGDSPGGIAGTAHLIENVPSYKSISGFEFSQRLLEHLQAQPVDIKYGKAEKIEKIENGFKVYMGDESFDAKYIIYATGTKRRKLGLEKEDFFYGKGLSYCATCDAPFYKGKVVAVVGGGDAALTAALLLAEYATKVYIFYRREKFFRAEPVWIEAVNANKKIEPVFNVNVKEYIGKDRLEAVKLDNGKKYELQGIFLEIGSLPNNELAKSIGVKIDESGYIVTDEFMESSVKNFFAVGDVRKNQMKQIIVAMSEGAIAASRVYERFSRG